MPEIVNQFLKTKDFAHCNKLKTNLFQTYNDDFHKYRKRVPLERLQLIFRKSPLLIGEKSIFSKITSAERVPIEVKSGASNRLKSLQVFIQDKKLNLGIRFNSKSPEFSKRKAEISGFTERLFDFLSLPL